MKKYHHLSNKIGTSCCVLTCPRSTKHADLSPYVRQAVAYSGQVPATPWLMVADERERDMWTRATISWETPRGNIWHELLDHNLHIPSTNMQAATGS